MCSVHSGFMLFYLWLPPLPPFKNCETHTYTSARVYRPTACMFFYSHRTAPFVCWACVGLYWQAQETAIDPRGSARHCRRQYCIVDLVCLNQFDFEDGCTAGGQDQRERLHETLQEMIVKPGTVLAGARARARAFMRSRVHMSACVHMCAFTCARACVLVCACVRVCECACVHVCARARTCVNMCVCFDSCVCVYICMFWCMHVCVRMPYTLHDTTQKCTA
jgi:hypothetical protein